MIPQFIHPDVKSRAEKRLFQELSHAPGTGDWICLHSLALAKHETQRAGEIDFLVITRRAVIILEVKGGRVARKGGLWIFTDRHNQSNSTTRGPFEQARNAMFTLERRLWDAKRKDLARLFFSYGVVIPDVHIRDELRNHDGTDSRVDRINDIDLLRDRDDMLEPISEYIIRLENAAVEIQTRGKFRYQGNRCAPTQLQADDLVDFLRGDFDVIVPLYAELAETTSTQIRLTREQYDIIDIVDPRLIVEGCAGTGKTLLALHHAKRQAKSGRRVLLLSYNRLLAGALELGTKVENGLVATSAYSFFAGAIQESGVLQGVDNPLESEFITEILPEYAALACLKRPPKLFDELVVDETQDLMQPWIFEVFDLLLEGGIAAGSWRLFLDPNNQAAVYGCFDKELYLRLCHHASLRQLSTNVRNTKPISSQANRIAKPKVMAITLTNGRPVDYRFFSNLEGEANLIRTTITELTEKHGMPGGRITVLSATKRPDWHAQPPVEGMRSVDVNLAFDLLTRTATPITWSTVSSFKGLENDVVILTGITQFESKWARAVTYVGMTRARLHLIVIFPEKLRNKVEDFISIIDEPLDHDEFMEVL